jgi:ribonuclease HII
MRNSKLKTQTLEIIEDDEEEEAPKKRIKKDPIILKKYHFEDPNILEIGVDEAGRGPLFGRVYTAAVVLPKNDTFDHSRMKDSKLFHSKKRITEVSDYIKEHALAWSVSYEDEKVIDEINILQATQKAMHKSIASANATITEKKALYGENMRVHLLIDGNYFNPYTQYNKTRKMVETISHTCFEGGDNKYTSIAAASILAKVSRDEYIEQLCEKNPDLVEKYGIDSNKGYGAKKHLDGIKEHGITIWHRRSFGICKQFVDV